MRCSSHDKLSETITDCGACKKIVIEAKKKKKIVRIHVSFGSISQFELIASVCDGQYMHYLSMFKIYIQYPYLHKSI